MKNKNTSISILIEEDMLSVEELQELVQCIRNIEQNKPKRVIKIFIDTPDKTTKEMKDIFSSIRPKFPYTEIIDFTKDDEKR